MKVEILGTESLGVRGLSCVVELKDRKIVIDPGIALGYQRHGLLPHPFQVAIGAAIREKIIEALKEATDIVISHFHGDHIPLPNPNPYQLGIDQVVGLLRHSKLWVKGPEGLSPLTKARRESLSCALFKEFPNPEGKKFGPLTFSLPVPHGELGEKRGKVMMTKIEEDNQVFVHASDIQLLNEGPIQKILEWHPTVVLASGPPLYLSLFSLSRIQRERAWKNAVYLARNVDTLILDHHLLRSEEGIKWLKRLARTTKNKVVSAADFVKRKSLFLETWRKELYQILPVPAKWHQNYAQRKVNFDYYRIKGWEALRKTNLVGQGLDR